jgi:hypothetical protein
MYCAYQKCGKYINQKYCIVPPGYDEYICVCSECYDKIMDSVVEGVRDRQRNHKKSSRRQ